MNEIRITDPFLRKIACAIGIMCTISLGFYTAGLLKKSLIVILSILAPFLAAFLMAYILAPLVIALQKQLKLGRIMGTLVLYAAILLVVFILLAFLIPTILSEFVKFFNNVKTTFPALLTQLAENDLFKIDSKLIETIKGEIKQIDIDYGSLIPGVKNIASDGARVFGKATKGIFSSLNMVIGFFSFLVFVGIINFYLIVDWEKIKPLMRKMVPPEKRERTFGILGKIDKAVGGFLRGQLTVSAIVGLMFGIGLFCISFTGFPALRHYCLLIGTAAAIGGFIPYLGALIGIAPAIVIILLAGHTPWNTKILTLVLVIALFSLIQAVEGFLLQPKIVGKGAGLHPLVVMLALIAGSQYGIGGMIISVPMASVIRVLVMEFYWNPVMEREAALDTTPL